VPRPLLRTFERASWSTVRGVFRSEPRHLFAIQEALHDRNRRLEMVDFCLVALGFPIRKLHVQAILLFSKVLGVFVPTPVQPGAPRGEDYGLSTLAKSDRIRDWGGQRRGNSGTCWVFRAMPPNGALFQCSNWRRGLIPSLAVHSRNSHWECPLWVKSSHWGDRERMTPLGGKGPPARMSTLMAERVPDPGIIRSHGLGEPCSVLPNTLPNRFF
jgi:hypothetical protein